MSRVTAIWFAIAGTCTLARWALELAELEDYDPGSVLEYAAAMSMSTAMITTGMALLSLWRHPPARRGSPLLPWLPLGQSLWAPATSSRTSSTASLEAGLCSLARWP